MNVLEMRKILVVDDEPMLREILREVLEFEGAQVTEAENGMEALRLHQEQGFSAVISDIRMPGGDGLELLEGLRQLDCITPVVMLITGFSDLSHDAAYRLGADAVLSKPFDVNELLSRLTFLLSPIGDRLSGGFKAESRIPSTGGEGPLLAEPGRGGIFIPGYFSAVTGESVAFSLSCPQIGGMLEGAGVVRWVRRTPVGDLPAGSGVELRFLDEGSVQRFLDWNKTHSRRAFIPDRIGE